MLIGTDMDLQSDAPLIALLGLVHLRIPLACVALSGTGRDDQGGIDDRALSHRHAHVAEVSFEGLKDLFAQPVLFQQMAKGQNRGLIRAPVSDHVDADKATHRGHLDQGLFHGWITQGVPLLQQMNPEHRCHRVGRTSSLLAGLGVDGLDQGDLRVPRDQRLHFSQELLAVGRLLSGCLLLIREAKLLSAHPFSPSLNSQDHSRADRSGFLESI